MCEKSQNKIEIFKTKDNQTEIKVKFEQETVWLNRHQLAILFDRDVKTIGKHINNVFKERELEEIATVAKFATVQKEGGREVERQVEHYNLDVIISVGYRVKSKRGTQFRQWATQRLKDFLVKGYAINEKRLEQKQQEILYLKTGIQILSRAIEAKNENQENEILNVFAKPKDDSFHSSINQIAQVFAGQELYPSIQEKAANLLYFIVKNHSFVDGNKRIAAACFLYFLDENKALINNNKPIISNEALASLTLFIATSKSDEADIVKRFVISVLNRNRNQ